jgi:hypothetical protein
MKKGEVICQSMKAVRVTVGSTAHIAHIIFEKHLPLSAPDFSTIRNVCDPTMLYYISII